MEIPKYIQNWIDEIEAKNIVEPKSFKYVFMLSVLEEIKRSKHTQSTGEIQFNALYYDYHKIYWKPMFEYKLKQSIKQSTNNKIFNEICKYFNKSKKPNSKNYTFGNFVYKNSNNVSFPEKTLVPIPNCHDLINNQNLWNLQNGTIKISMPNLEILQNYILFLQKLLYFKWAQLLGILNKIDTKTDQQLKIQFSKFVTILFEHYFCNKKISRIKITNRLKNNLDLFALISSSKLVANVTFTALEIENKKKIEIQKRREINKINNLQKNFNNIIISNNLIKTKQDISSWKNLFSSEVLFYANKILLSNVINIGYDNKYYFAIITINEKTFNMHIKRDFSEMNCSCKNKSNRCRHLASLFLKLENMENYKNIFYNYKNSILEKLALEKNNVKDFETSKYVGIHNLFEILNHIFKNIKIDKDANNISSKCKTVKSNIYKIQDKQGKTIYANYEKNIYDDLIQKEETNFATVIYNSSKNTNEDEIILKTDLFDIDLLKDYLNNYSIKIEVEQNKIYVISDICFFIQNNRIQNENLIETHLFKFNRVNNLLIVGNDESLYWIYLSLKEFCLLLKDYTKKFNK